MARNAADLKSAYWQLFRAAVSGNDLKESGNAHTRARHWAGSGSGRKSRCWYRGVWRRKERDSHGGVRIIVSELPRLVGVFSLVASKGVAVERRR
jgi:hypothetical protein